VFDDIPLEPSPTSPLVEGVIGKTLINSGERIAGAAWRSAGIGAPISTPRRRARDERTWSRSRSSPSISLDLTTSSVSERNIASVRSSSPRPPCNQSNALGHDEWPQRVPRSRFDPTGIGATLSIRGYRSPFSHLLRRMCLLFSACAT
jgi:hypothetical protein